MEISCQIREVANWRYLVARWSLRSEICGLVALYGLRDLIVVACWHGNEDTGFTLEANDRLNPFGPCATRETNFATARPCRKLLSNKRGCQSLCVVWTR